ncbi:PP2C family protein-serine/threonine phosphatase [Variovorax ginsengisoli]|uniref:Serine/threonine protein phosphatase PrpC n=1 Tax=Variovorax ginsengisoli TaxID=363844 RepID=A0ABT9S9J9_9BURK|nr:protein phosphatase 2C domain-containing protein [Variovorax ginsengisoli]MDP9901031.1 serine/threonine protein phosphatase PrpC [Variovorax ginsengisoli]
MTAAAPAIELAILSRPGGRGYNEDACGHWHSERHLVCVVADGAGGHGGGDIAARIAVRHIIERFAAAPVMLPGEVQALLLETNATVIRHRADGAAQANMHSTVVSLFIDLQRAEASWGHAGDSRLYLFRDGQLLSHTHDHSVVQAMVDAGALTPGQMRTHPRRSELLSALGSAPEHLHLSAEPAPCALRPGDVFLLCTDGLWEYVDDAEMCQSLAAAEHPQAWLQALEQAVLRNAAAQQKPGHDNFSGISVWVGAAAPEPH